MGAWDDPLVSLVGAQAEVEKVPVHLAEHLVMDWKDLEVHWVAATVQLSGQLSGQL